MASFYIIAFHTYFQFSIFFLLEQYSYTLIDFRQWSISESIGAMNKGFLAVLLAVEVVKKLEKVIGIIAVVYNWYARSFDVVIEVVSLTLKVVFLIYIYILKDYLNIIEKATNCKKKKEKEKLLDIYTREITLYSTAQSNDAWCVYLKDILYFNISRTSWLSTDPKLFLRLIYKIELTR